MADGDKSRPGYDRLTPDHRYLSDEAVLVQAWKKSHEYIRRHNWYADSLELDVSAVCLNTLVPEWAGLLSGPRARQYRPDPMRLVLAPKRGRWVIGEGHRWGPADKEPRLRPLAHLSIRDQTIATAAMMCLADAVESAQGDTAPPPRVWRMTQEHPTFRTESFGNRLVCQWDVASARFRWGNAKMYREYYDYRTFVARVEESRSPPTGMRLASVSVDLKQFYDCIDRTVLVDKLRAIIDRHNQRFLDEPMPFTDEFFQVLPSVFGWTWHKADRADVKRFAPAAVSTGLPQGLVASGFFANAYLIDFDRAVGNDKLDPIGRGWWVDDYCRYVDDMRFKVFVQDHVSPDTLKTEFTDAVETLLAGTAPGVTLNADKTEVSMADPLPGVIQVGQTMQAIQRAVSGPLDVAAADQVLGLIDGLFPAAERAAVTRERGGLPKGENDPILLEVFTTDLDVRPDTVERFAANRWRRVYRNLRVMTDDGPADLTVPSGSRVLLDVRATAFAKTLIRRWIADPSNVRLLRIALDVYPTRRMLGLVLSMLSRPFRRPGRRPIDRAARLACLYVLAELFRAGATETGLVRDPDMLPAGSRMDRYRSRLRRAATWCVRQAGELPWYVHQQAMLYLAACGPESVLPGAGLLAGSEYVELHDLLAPASMSFRPSGVDPVRGVALALVAFGLNGDDGRLAARVAATLSAAGGPALTRAVELLVSEGGPLVAPVRNALVAIDQGWSSVLDNLSPAIPAVTDPKLANRHPYRLNQIAAHPANPFGQENAALILAVRLMETWPAPQNPSQRHAAVVAAQVVVQCEDWDRLADPHVARTKRFLQVEIGPPLDHPGLKSLLPAWCGPQRAAWRVEFGRLLRAAVTGRDDLVGVGSSAAGAAPDDTVTPALRYRGIRTSVYKRQFGVFNGPSQLGRSAAPVSPWLGELLQGLLRWPGVEPLNDLIELPPEFGSAEVLTLLQARLDRQQHIYGRASDMQVYEVPIRLPPDRVDRVTGQPKPLTAVLVQTVLPTMKDLGDATDVTLATPAYRRQHRRHLTAVLQLLSKTIGCRDTHVCNPTCVDLVLMPELSVHPDDLFLVERTADQLKAIVFCGTVFHANPLGGAGPVNTGVWLIPDLRRSGRQMIRIEQGKWNLTPWEVSRGIQPFRPCQWVIQGRSGNGPDWRLSAAICYDATDIQLAADLRNLTDGFIVAALNQDVSTFDNMVAALHYHMFQHLMLVNSGEFGGTTVQAPHKERHERVRVHAHGGHHVVLSICELDLLACRPAGFPKMKTPPAGLNRP